MRNNANDLETEIAWLSKVIDLKLQAHLEGTQAGADLLVHPPLLNPEISVYASFVDHYALTRQERLLLILVMAPHLKPEVLDAFFSVNKKSERGYTEYGGIKGLQHGGFIPTGETFVFLAGSGRLDDRFILQKIFDRDHFFAKHNIIHLEPVPDGESFLSGQLTISRDFLELLTTGESHKPDLSVNFPARRIYTELTWSDLVLEEKTLRQLDEIKTWLAFGNKLLVEWEMARKLRKGYRCLFYGPPGTGKTMTASLLGKEAELDVYRIDLSMVVSKYIGETEKNLSRIFNQAEHKNWILFFDEADALFGKRTSVSDAHDRYANQEVSYLLQRIEEFDGLILLASNMKENLDDSFTRRFESIIHFPLPRADRRLEIWKKGLPAKATLAPDLDLKVVASNYEISGGSIMNAIAYASLKALQTGNGVITKHELLQGIKKEFEKEGRTASIPTI